MIVSVSPSTKFHQLLLFHTFSLKYYPKESGTTGYCWTFVFLTQQASVNRASRAPDL